MHSFLSYILFKESGLCVLLLFLISDSVDLNTLPGYVTTAGLGTTF